MFFKECYIKTITGVYFEYIYIWIIDIIFVWHFIMFILFEIKINFTNYICYSNIIRVSQLENDYYNKYNYDH